jgi:very-short-patch-repair endonuclease
MRHAPNDAEAAIWDLLRDRQLGGFKFRRQHSLGDFIVDYCCLQVRLVVELDGKSHFGNEEADARRQEWLQSQGFVVMRFSNGDVNESAEQVAEAIWRKCVELAESHDRAGS